MYVCVVTAQIFLAASRCGILCLIATFVTLHFTLFSFVLSQFDAVHTPFQFLPASLFTLPHLSVPRRCSLQSKRSDGSTIVGNGRDSNGGSRGASLVGKTTCHMLSASLVTLVLSAASLPYLSHSLPPAAGISYCVPCQLVKIQCEKTTAPPAGR